jgi:hypothetical protein
VIEFTGRCVMVEKRKLTKENIMKWVTNQPLIVADDQGNHLYHCRTCYTGYLTEREAQDCCTIYDELFWEELRVMW